MTTDPGSTPYVPGSRPDNWTYIGGGRWSYTYDGLVGSLKRAAIDAYICTLPLSHGDHYRALGDHYEAENPRWAWIARPGPDGSGGGHNIPNPNASWQDGMDDVPPVCAPPGDSRYVASEVSECARLLRITEIRAEVDRIVDPWRDLPDPEVIGAVVDSWRTIFLDLCERAERPDAGAGSLRKNLGYITDILDGSDAHGRHLQSSTIETFTSYVDNLRVAVDCCQDTALVLGVALTAEQGLWECAKKDFAAIVWSATRALSECARAGGRNSKGFDIPAVLSVASAVVGAFGLFTGPIGTGVSAVTSFGLTIASEVVSSSKDDTKEDNAHDYWSLLQRLRDLLGDEVGLSHTLKDEEQYLRNNLLENITALANGRIDPTPEPITSTTGIIRTDPALSDRIINTLMPAVSDELDRISWSIGTSIGEVHSGAVDILKRAALVGDAPTGPTDAFIALADLLKSALAELNLEVYYGAHNLRAAVDALESSDDSVKAALISSAIMASESTVSLLAGRPFSF